MHDQDTKPNYESSPDDNQIADTDGQKALATDSFVDWSAVFAGGLIAVAISVILTTFGAALGITVTSPWSGGFSSETVTIASAIWFALVHLYAIGMGAYLAGRLRTRVQVTDRKEIEFRDGMSGLVVWALAIVASGLLAVQFAATTVSVSASITGNIAGSAANAGGLVLERSVDSLLRQPVGQIASGDQTVSNKSAEPGQQVANAPNPGTADRAEITRILTNRLADGELSKADRGYLRQVIATETGLNPIRAEERLDETLATAKERIKEATEDARQSTAAAGFWTAFIFLLSGISAWWGGAMGGSHRDDPTV